MRIRRTKVVFDISTENTTSVTCRTQPLLNLCRWVSWLVPPLLLSTRTTGSRRHMFLALDDIIEVIEIEVKMQKSREPLLQLLHVDDVRVDSLEDYQHMLQALYGEELAQQDQGNVSASDSGAEQSDQESSRRRNKRPHMTFADCQPCFSPVHQKRKHFACGKPTKAPTRVWFQLSAGFLEHCCVKNPSYIFKPLFIENLQHHSVQFGVKTFHTVVL
eukprot:g47495.t1